MFSFSPLSIHFTRRRYRLGLKSYPAGQSLLKMGSFLSFCLLLSGCGQQTDSQQTSEAASLPVGVVQAGSQTTYQDYPASIEGLTNVEIRPQISGILDRVLVDEGVAVKAGQPLFKINEAPYRERLNNALALQHAAEGALAGAQLEANKYAPLVEHKVVSDIQLKTAQAALMVAEANLQRAKTEVSSAHLNLGYTLIKAPVSGYVGRLHIKQGSLVGPSDAQALTQISDVHQVHVYFSLGEDDFHVFRKQYAGNTLEEKIAKLPPVTLLLSDQSTYPKGGKVDMVDGQFDKTTGAITLRATFPNASGLLRSGNTGKVQLPLNHPNLMLVPTAATIDMQDKVFVYAVGDSNRVSRKKLTILGKSGQNYLVSEGVRNGDRIVLQGLDHLQEGQVIKPTQPVIGSTAAGQAAL